MSLSSNHDPWYGVTRWEPPLVGGALEVREPPAADVPEAGVDLEALERAARERGHADGLLEGREAARRELAQFRDRFEGLLVAIARPLQSLDAATERELTGLAMVVARRVIAHELHTHPALIQQAVQEAAAALPSARRGLRIHLHPEDLTLLRESNAIDVHWELLPDPALAPGDCRLETESSRLDARVEARLASIVDAVLGDGDGETGDVP